MKIALSKKSMELKLDFQTDVQGRSGLQRDDLALQTLSNTLGIPNGKLLEKLDKELTLRLQGMWGPSDCSSKKGLN